MKGWVFLLVFAMFFNVSMKRDMLIVTLFFARCCFNVNTLLQHAATCSFSKFPRTMNMTLTCPTPPLPSTYHEHDVNMPHPTPPLAETWGPEGIYIYPSYPSNHIHIHRQIRQYPSYPWFPSYQYINQSICPTFCSALGLFASGGLALDLGFRLVSNLETKAP